MGAGEGNRGWPRRGAREVPGTGRFWSRYLEGSRVREKKTKAAAGWLDPPTSESGQPRLFWATALNSDMRLWEAASSILRISPSFPCCLLQRFTCRNPLTPALGGFFRHPSPGRPARRGLAAGVRPGGENPGAPWRAWRRGGAAGRAQRAVPGRKPAPQRRSAAQRCCRPEHQPGIYPGLEKSTLG